MKTNYAESSRWVSLLPEVGDPILAANDAIGDLLREADSLASQAQTKRQEAYRKAVALEARIGELWTAADVAAARQKAKALRK